MTHLVEAGADFFVMPSVFEPCGLNQMYSQRYGTVPLCSRVGGLLDTVIDIEDRPATGTGLLFTPSMQGLTWALERSQVLFRDKPRMQAVIRRGMQRDFGWGVAAKQYERLYQETL